MKVIGIDIDETLTKTIDGIEKYIINHGDEFEDSEQLLLDAHHILAGNRVSNDTTKFLNNIYHLITENLELREDAVNVLNKLRNKGDKIILITARADAYYPRGAELITLEYLNKLNVPYDTLVTHSLNKRQACIDYNVDIMIDDSVNTCESLAKEGIRTLLFNTKINQDIETNILRVNNWLEIYEIIKNE